MDASLFIASKLRFKGKVAMICIAVSYLVMIIAVSISSGFRHELRSSLSEISGDVLLSSPDLNVMGEDRPLDLSDPALSYVESSDLVSKMLPVVWRAGIVRHEGNMHGVVVKGVPSESSDSVSLGVSIPRALAQSAGLRPGDKMLTYFIGEQLKARQFNVISVYDPLAQTDDRHVVYASLADMQRLNGWDAGQVSAVEVHLAEGLDDEEDITSAAAEISFMIGVSQEDPDIVAVSSVSRYPQLFNWLSLIDFNVGIILLLMTIVAGFNMISGLLILLFENTSTIGILKSLGMNHRAISKVFLVASARLVGMGMLAGNVLALLFCLIQGTTHLLKLDPENYYVSFVPVNMDLGMILLADVVSFIVIMVLLLIPCIFISKVDPARTVRVR